MGVEKIACVVPGMSLGFFRGEGVKPYVVFTKRKGWGRDESRKTARKYDNGG